MDIYEAIESEACIITEIDDQCKNGVKLCEAM